MDQPLEHVLREQPPWRADPPPLTECGRTLDEGATALTREELTDRVSRMGIQRTSLFVCMTCIDTVRNNRATWHSNPLALLHRETSLALRTGDNGPLEAEVRALALIVQRNPDILTRALEELAQVTPLRRIRRKTR